jgi:putative ABC transport system ATP-binding protein
MHYIGLPLSGAPGKFDAGGTVGGAAARRLLRSAPAVDDNSSRTKVDGCMPPTIVARDIDKSFGSGRTATPVLRGVSLELARGESVFLIGPSGSGKTTLLSLLGCILTADRGQIEVLGQDVSRLAPEQRAAFRRNHIGFVFQNFNLFPTLSALDNVRLALCIRGVAARAAKRRAGELLEQVGLSHRARLRPSRLSTGECQRVAIARALAGDPAILMADEPTAALDAENGQAVMRLFTDLVRDRRSTLLVVTHDNRIFPFADRILRLSDGRLPLAETPARQRALAEVRSVARTRHQMECVQ